MQNLPLERKIHNRKEIIVAAKRWQYFGEKIVFTNGCFDLLHKGHVNYLFRAKQLGTKLIVAINSDDSVKRLNKGPERPLNDELSRAYVLAGLSCIDAICTFEEDTPLEIISSIVPNVLVKGGDWSEDQIVGSSIVKENGGEVHSLEFVDGFSTTSIVERIMNA